MTPEIWAKLEELFHRASGLSNDERVAFLDIECADDTLLRTQLDLMLASLGKARKLERSLWRH